jgi:hypothetical protein
MIAIPDMSTNNSSFVRSTDHQKQSIPEFNELLETQCKCFSFLFQSVPFIETEEDSSGGDDAFISSAAAGRMAEIWHGGEDESSRWAGRQGAVKFLAFLDDD